MLITFVSSSCKKVYWNIMTNRRRLLKNILLTLSDCLNFEPNWETLNGNSKYRV